MTSPMHATLVEAATRDHDLLETVRAVVEWRTTPTEWSGGRAGWVELHPQLARPGCRGLKVKGLGYLHPATGQPCPPDTHVYDRWPGQAPDPHFGITPDADFALLMGDEAPLGGLPLESALREQRCAAELTEADVPAVQPIAAFKFDALSFENSTGGRSIGVSLTASPLPRDVRLSLVLAPLGGAVEAELDRLDAAFRTAGTPLSANMRCLHLLGEGYRAFGHSIRKFSSAGWYRYSGHPGNITIGPNGEALLVDLDSCRPAADVTPAIAAMESVRDGMSALYNLACSFFHEPARTRFSDDEIEEHQPFSAFLMGWDPHGDPSQAISEGRRIAAYVNASRRQLRFFAPFLNAKTEAGCHLYRHVRHDRDLTFAWLFRLLYERRLARPDFIEMPLSLTTLDSRLRCFTGLERWSKLEVLES